MKIISRGDISSEVWDEFCDASPDAWVRHTASFIELGITLGGRGVDLSFGVKEGDSLVGVVPLVIQGDEQREFAMGGTPIPFPALRAGLALEERNEILIEIFRELERRALGYGVSKACLFVDPLARSSAQQNSGLLSKFGFGESPFQTCILDLDASPDEILSRMRKGHRSDIRFAQKSGYFIEHFDTHSQSAFDDFRNLYFAAAGREVGTKDRWECTARLSREGRILLMFGGASCQARESAIAILVFKECAYYMLSGTLPKARLAHRGIGHLLQWEAMQYLKRHGFQKYELGWQESATPKDLAIAAFKRHFGGTVVSVCRGERRYP